MWTCPKCMAIPVSFARMAPAAPAVAASQHKHRNSTDIRSREPLIFRSCIPPFAAVTLSVVVGDGKGAVELFYLTFLPAAFFLGGNRWTPKTPKTIQCDAEDAFACTMISLGEGARAWGVASNGRTLDEPRLRAIKEKYLPESAVTAMTVFRPVAGIGAGDRKRVLLPHLRHSPTAACPSQIIRLG